MDGTDGHGNAEDVVNDNGDNLRPNQLPGALEEDILTTDEHGNERDDKDSAREKLQQ